MFAFKAGGQPANSPRVLRRGLAASAASLLIAGCASAPSQQAAVKPVAVAQAVEMEADGRPAQTPPDAHVRALPDEPAEPFSKNYGGKNPSAEKNAAPVTPVRAPMPLTPKIPEDLPPAFRKKLMQAMADDE